MIKRMASAFAILLLTSTVAIAGNTTLKHASGAKVKIKCTGGGCVVRQTDAAGKKGKAERGPGGSANFNKHVASFKAKGYK